MTWTPPNDDWEAWLGQDFTDLEVEGWQLWADNQSARIAGSAKVRKAKIGRGVVIRSFCNIYECEIGEQTKIGAHCTIGRCKIGARCKIQDFTLICDGHVIEDEVFIGGLVTFCNCKEPGTVKPDGTMRADGDWLCEPVHVFTGSVIGSGAMIGPGVTIGPHAVVATGAVVFRDVPEGMTAIGNPARCMPKGKKVE